MAAPIPPSSASRRPREPGSAEMTIGSFKRLEEIGKGSFATVYKAIHVGPQKTRSYVAIKSVTLAKLNKKLKDNLFSEIDILKRLQHPHIVALIDRRETTNYIHLVMEYCSLGDLSYFIKKRDTLANHETTREMIAKYPNPPAGGLNEVVVRHFLKQLASALQFLRARNLIHRDVKPQNLLLNPSPLFYAKEQPSIMPFQVNENSLIPAAGIESLPVMKIADFGFARSLPSTSLAETLCGSPLYMAPEILRYEKYDAKADLWSVGTVLFEMMVGRPPFRASNHVELLRKIERGDDDIKFSKETVISDAMKSLIRSLLKRNPVERMTFNDFFDHTVVRNEIPGLVDEDRPPEKPRIISETDASSADRRKLALLKDAQTSNTDVEDQLDNGGKHHSSKDRPKDAPEAGNPRSPVQVVTQRTPSGAPAQPTPLRRVTSRDKPAQTPDVEQPESPISPRRPNMITHTTAPAGHDLHHERAPVAAAAVMERQRSRNTPSPGSSLLREQVQDRDRDRQAQKLEDRASREERERAAQEVAFERDYVVVEKRAVEVNAFADELAASPRIHGGQNQLISPQSGAMVRRATTQGAPSSVTGASVTPSRAMQIATGRQRPEAMHQRQASYERRYGPSPGSATSAISKALNMASGRLFGVGFSPPLGIGRGGRSPPPGYNPFPAYPTAQGSLVVVGDGSKTSLVLDEDSKAIHVIEECATRSDVVYGFAEVKYKQLIPLAPSMQSALGLRQASISPRPERDSEGTADEGLTVDAIVTLSEEALVLYVKALSLLAKSMDIAGAWWARKNRGEVIGDTTSPRAEPSSSTNPAVGNRVNNVVQWVRNRFNEVLEKAEFVRLRLIEGQNRLPSEHPSHPNNHSCGTGPGPNTGNSVDHVVVGSGVTAEKLMYDRALEMSRTAAINEITGEDLPGCEIAYVTAMRMLEAVLDNDDDPTPRKNSGSDKEPKPSDNDELAVNGVEGEDRKVIVKLVASIRTRLNTLRKKMAVIQKRASAPAMGQLAKATPTTHLATIPAIATTPPK